MLRYLGALIPRYNINVGTINPFGALWIPCGPHQCIGWHTQAHLPL